MTTDWWRETRTKEVHKNKLKLNVTYASNTADSFNCTLNTVCHNHKTTQ